MPDQSSAATEHSIIQEITAPLETMPDDPLSLVDADFPTALRGYERVAVDEYVEQTRRLVAELQATRSPEAAVRRALERVGDQISGILQRAHETAEQITAQSRSEAEDRLQQARNEAELITDAAEGRVKELDADTDRIWLERQRIVADAEDLAARLTTLATVAAERFPTDEETDGPAGDAEALMAGTPIEAGAPEAEGPAWAASIPAGDDGADAHHVETIETADDAEGARDVADAEGAHDEPERPGADGEPAPQTDAAAEAEADEESAVEASSELFDRENLDGGDFQAGDVRDDPELEAAPDPEDVERTVAFTPLQRARHDDPAPRDDAPSEPEAQPAPGEPETGERDSGRPQSHVIRPASQAASRRLGR